MIIYVAPAARVEHSALYAVMGDDGAAGTIEINVTISTIARSATASRGSVGTSCKICPCSTPRSRRSQISPKARGGRVIPNPVWKLLPAELDLVA